MESKKKTVPAVKDNSIHTCIEKVNKFEIDGTLKQRFIDILTQVDNIDSNIIDFYNFHNFPKKSGSQNGEQIPRKILSL